MTYTRYAVISQAEQRAVSWHSQRRHANARALDEQRKTGGVYLVARIVAYTDALVRENVTRRPKVKVGVYRPGEVINVTRRSSAIRAS